MSYEKKPGEAVAWKPKAPNHPLSIKCTAHRALAEGEEFEVAIWPVQERKNENSPAYSGRVQNKWTPQEKQGATGTDDGIPF